MIENPKIASLCPQAWASFPGFSVLFTSAGEVDRYNPFVQALRQFTDNLDKTENGLALQNHSDYHVTAWDGVNPANLDLLTPSLRPLAESILEKMPASLSIQNEFFDEIMASDLYQVKWELSFEFRDLSVVRNSTLAARLKIERKYEEEFTSFCLCRKALNKRFRDRFNHQNFDNYEPHITLGYFADTYHAELAKAHVRNWSSQIQQKISEFTLATSGVEIHGFQDMGRFISRSDLKLHNKEKGGGICFTN